jgi:hypothetical protein
LLLSDQELRERMGKCAADFATSAKGVTNGDSHDHNSGDGAAIVEAAITLADNTTNDASTTKHFCSKGYIWGAPDGMVSDDALFGVFADDTPISFCFDTSFYQVIKQNES